MSGAPRKFFSGSSVQQALMSAARYHRIDPDKIAYRELEKRHGFLNVRRSVVIEVDPEAPAKGAGEAPTASTPPVHPSPAEPPSREATPTPVSAVDLPEAVEPSVPRAQPAPPVDRLDGSSDTATADPTPSPGDLERHRSTTFPSDDSIEVPAEVPVEVPAEVPVEVPVEAPVAEDSAEPAPSAGEIREAVEDATDLRFKPASAADRFSVAEGAEADAAIAAAEKLFALADLDLDVEAFTGEDGLLLEVSGTDQDRFLDERGRALLAVQHLVPRLLWGALGRTTPVRVDCDNFHEIRQETLRDLAQRAASKVRRRGRPWHLNPMAPDERRIVHLTLADDPGVETESVGDGYFKRVRVKPVAGGRVDSHSR